MTTAAEHQEAPPHTLYTVSGFAQRHDFLTEGALRFQIFNANNNGLAETGAIVRVGRKVLLNEPKYFGWMEG
mgnify:CR=1 FL=1|jgi:hypothetical protein